MNMNTLTQELHKKIKMMDRQTFINFINKLYGIWIKYHRKNNYFVIDEFITEDLLKEKKDEESRHV